MGELHALTQGLTNHHRANIFSQKLLFSDDGEIFQLWERPPVDLYLKVYLFNITNHEDFLAGRAKKLNVEEIGPYVYR